MSIKSAIKNVADSIINIKNSFFLKSNVKLEKKIYKNNNIEEVKKGNETLISILNEMINNLTDLEKLSLANELILEVINKNNEKNI